MATLLEITNLYHELSFLDRIVFYTTLSNDVSVHEEDIHSFLVKTRMQGEKVCVHCGQSHIVKNGKRKDGTQRYLCRDCHKSFLPSSGSIVSRSRKPVSLWAVFLKEEFFTQLFARLLNASITRYGADISNRAPLPV